MNQIPPYVLFVAIPLLAAVACGFSIPKIILLAKRKKLFDLPDNHRKIHKEVVPNLGGVGIFFSFAIVASIFIKFETFHTWNYLIAASMILFVVGIKDDIISLTPTKKFLAQIVAAVITVYVADIRLFSLHGILGIDVMPGWLSVVFSIVGCIFITNAFNLIDGIDGLAGTIGVLCSFALGTCLFIQENYSAAYVAFALMGAIMGFLRYNIAPARIFMGDSGSLFIGFTISVLSIIFINSFDPSNNLLASFIHTPKGALIFALSVLFIPVFDSFRVFVTRIAKGHSPFRADRTHLHHYLLDLGFSHSNTVTTLITANLLIISVSLLVQDLNPNIAIAAILTLTFGLFAILYFMRKSRLAKTEIIKSKLNINEPETSALYTNGKEKIKVSAKTVNLPAAITSESH
ncbi:MAG TPA: MraY family glycosyltransferase [Flavipsychrobacter sp.]|nr:MraY family glycosyltransferase [Flavipsychrobacter sp.]